MGVTQKIADVKAPFKEGVVLDFNPTFSQGAKSIITLSRDQIVTINGDLSDGRLYVEVRGNEHDFNEAMVRPNGRDGYTVLEETLWERDRATD